MSGSPRRHDRGRKGDTSSPGRRRGANSAQAPGTPPRRPYLLAIPAPAETHHMMTPGIRPNLMKLPDDLLRTILTYLKHPELVALISVCKRGREVAGADVIWKKLYRAVHGAGRRPPGCSHVLPWRWMYGQRECQRLFRGPYQRKDFTIPVPTLDVANQDAGDSATGEARATPGSPPATPVLRQPKSAVVAPHSAPHTARPGAGRGGGESGGGTSDSGGRVVGRPRSMSLGSADSGAKPAPPTAGAVTYLALLTGGKLLASTDRGEAAVWSTGTDSLLKHTNPSLTTSAIEAKRRKDAQRKYTERDPGYSKLVYFKINRASDSGDGGGIDLWGNAPPDSDDGSHPHRRLRPSSSSDSDEEESNGAGAGAGAGGGGGGGSGTGTSADGDTNADADADVDANASGGAATASTDELSMGSGASGAPPSPLVAPSTPGSGMAAMRRLFLHGTEAGDGCAGATRHFAGLSVSPVSATTTPRGDAATPGGEGSAGDYSSTTTATDSDDATPQSGHRFPGHASSRSHGKSKSKKSRRKQKRRGNHGGDSDDGAPPAASGRAKWPAANRKRAEARDKRLAARWGKRRHGGRKSAKSSQHGRRNSKGSVEDDAAPPGVDTPEEPARLSKRMRKRQEKRMHRIMASNRRQGSRKRLDSAGSTGSTTSGHHTGTVGSGAGAVDGGITPPYGPRCALSWMPLQPSVGGGQVVVPRGRLHTVVVFNDGAAAIVDSSQLARAAGRHRRRRRKDKAGRGADASLYGARVVAWLDDPLNEATRKQGLTACCTASGDPDVPGTMGSCDMVAAAFGRSVCVWRRNVQRDGAPLAPPTVGAGSGSSVAHAGHGATRGAATPPAVPAVSSQQPQPHMFVNMCSYSGHAASVKSVACHVSADGAMVASGDAVGCVHVWDGVQGLLHTVLRLFAETRAPQNVQARAHVSEAVVQTVMDEFVIVAAGELGTVCVWSWHLRQSRLYVSCLARRSGVHAGHVTAVAVAPARQPLPYAATGGEDEMVRLWYRPIHTVSGDSLTAAEAVAKEKQADKKRMLLRGHNAPITAVHLDTFKIVSTSADGVLKIWDAEEAHIGRCLRSINVSAHPIYSLFCTPLTLVCGAGDGTVVTFNFARGVAEDRGLAGTRPSAGASRRKQSQKITVPKPGGRRTSRGQNSGGSRRGLRDLRAAVNRSASAAREEALAQLNFSAYDLQLMHDNFLRNHGVHLRDASQ